LTNSRGASDSRRRRCAISRCVGAFDAFGEARRELLWRARDAHRTSPAFTRPALALPTSDAPALPVLTEQERVALDYRITGIPTGPQIMRFYRADLDRRGVLTAAGLRGTVTAPPFASRERWW
jgi:error-prone DNA polymerase